MEQAAKIIKYHQRHDDKMLDTTRDRDQYFLKKIEEAVSYEHAFMNIYLSDKEKRFQVFKLKIEA